MNIWLRRGLMVLFALFWLALILTPTFAFVLARNGQIQIGEIDGRHWRVFMLQQADTEGIGLERARPVDAPADLDGPIQCLKTTIDYWMWRGEGMPADYCQCMDATTGTVVDVVPPACLLP